MKKTVVSIFTGLLLVVSASAESITLTNTLGGNSDNSGTSDFLKFDKDWKKQDLAVGERIQLDVSSEHLDGRVRINVSKEANYLPAVQGYVNVRPIKQLNLIAGNVFFWKWASSPAYLPAIGDYLAHGKLVDNNGFGIVTDFSSEDSDISFKFASSFASEARFNLNFGTEFGIKDLFTVSATAQDVTENSRSFGFYAGLKLIKNLTLNLGYTFNNTDETYIQGTQHLIQAAAGFVFEELKLSLFADVLAGLTNRSNYNTTANDYVELNSGVPVYATLAANFKVLEELELNASVNFNHKLLATDSVNAVTLYPYFDFKTKYGTIRSGARIFFDDKEGYKGFNIPLSWQYAISK